MECHSLQAHLTHSNGQADPGCASRKSSNPRSKGLKRKPTKHLPVIQEEAEGYPSADCLLGQQAFSFLPISAPAPSESPRVWHNAVSRPEAAASTAVDGHISNLALWQQQQQQLSGCVLPTRPATVQRHQLMPSASPAAAVHPAHGLSTGPTWNLEQQLPPSACVALNGSDSFNPRYQLPSAYTPADDAGMVPTKPAASHAVHHAFSTGSQGALDRNQQQSQQQHSVTLQQLSPFYIRTPGAGPQPRTLQEVHASASDQPGRHDHYSDLDDARSHYMNTANRYAGRSNDAVMTPHGHDATQIHSQGSMLMPLEIVNGLEGHHPATVRAGAHAQAGIHANLHSDPGLHHDASLGACGAGRPTLYTQPGFPCPSPTPLSRMSSLGSQLMEATTPRTPAHLPDPTRPYQSPEFRSETISFPSGHHQEHASRQHVQNAYQQVQQHPGYGPRPDAMASPRAGISMMHAPQARQDMVMRAAPGHQGSALQYTRQAPSSSSAGMVPGPPPWQGMPMCATPGHQSSALQYIRQAYSSSSADMVPGPQPQQGMCAAKGPQESAIDEAQRAAYRQFPHGPGGTESRPAGNLAGGNPVSGNPGSTIFKPAGNNGILFDPSLRSHLRTGSQAGYPGACNLGPGVVSGEKEWTSEGPFESEEGHFQSEQGRQMSEVHLGVPPIHGQGSNEHGSISPIERWQEMLKLRHQMVQAASRKRRSRKRPPSPALDCEVAAQHDDSQHPREEVPDRSNAAGQLTAAGVLSKAGQSPVVERGTGSTLGPGGPRELTADLELRVGSPEMMDVQHVRNMDDNMRQRQLEEFRRCQALTGNIAGDVPYQQQSSAADHLKGRDKLSPFALQSAPSGVPHATRTMLQQARPTTSQAGPMSSQDGCQSSPGLNGTAMLEEAPLTAVQISHRLAEDDAGQVFHQSPPGTPAQQVRLAGSYTDDDTAAAAAAAAADGPVRRLQDLQLGGLGRSTEACQAYTGSAAAQAGDASGLAEQQSAIDAALLERQPLGPGEMGFSRGLVEARQQFLQVGSFCART